MWRWKMRDGGVAFEPKPVAHEHEHFCVRVRRASVCMHELAKSPACPPPRVDPFSSPIPSRRSLQYFGYPSMLKCILETHLVVILLLHSRQIQSSQRRRTALSAHCTRLARCCARLVLFTFQRQLLFVVVVKRVVARVGRTVLQSEALEAV